MGLSLNLDIFLHKSTSESALCLFHYKDIFSNLELGHSLSYEYVILLGLAIDVEENLDVLCATRVIVSKEAVVVGP